MYLSMSISFSHGNMCLGPYGASICAKEALFVVEAVHYKLELILKMTYVEGEHYMFLFISSIHCWHYSMLGGVHCVPHGML